jgi:DNA-binding response OmpR family regulator
MNTGKKRILIVDDDPDFTEAVSFSLKESGFEVFTAANATEGLKVAGLERPDLILMDIMMGERTEGLFAVQQLRHDAQLAKIPVFVLSAIYSKVPEFDVAPENAWMGGDKFFSKPVDMTQLVRRIREQLDETDGGARTAGV